MARPATVSSSDRNTAVQRRGWRSIAALVRDESGASAMIIGLLAMVLIAFAALGTEVGTWYFTHRDLQNAADSAAMSAVAALGNVQGAPPAPLVTQATAEAKAAAAFYNFVDTQNGVTVAVNIPPTAGGYKNTPNAVEVIITEPQQLTLSAALVFGGQQVLANNPIQSVRAVATPGTNGNGCVVTLDKAAVVDLFTNGNTVINIPTCDLYVNSDAADALDQVGKATITAESAFITGGASGTAQTGLTTSKGTFTGTPPINDPYANLKVQYTSPGAGCTNAAGGDTPSSGGSLVKDTFGNETYAHSPAGGMMVFCGGWNPTGNNVHLDPGLYVVDGGTFGCNGCTITGDNVTIYLTGSNGTYATMQFAGNGQLNINAPTDAYVQANQGTQAIEGIAIFIDRNSPLTGTPPSPTFGSAFSGNATATINGVIYAPTQSVVFNGNGNSTPTCAQIVTYNLTFHGNSSFQNNCSAFQNAQTGGGVQNIGAIPAFLVE